MAIKKQANFTINAPLETVFDAIANVSEFKKAAPHIVKVEMLSDIQKGVGTKFRETRLMNGKESSTELEIKEYVENERARFVADQGGTIWDTLFTTEKAEDGVLLNLEMEARPYKFMSKLVTPMIMGMVGKAIQSDIEAVKTYCEENANAAA